MTMTMTMIVLRRPRILAVVSLLLALCCFLIPCVQAQRQQSEDIVEDTVWSVDVDDEEQGEVIQIVKDIFVDKDSTLTINPGVHVEFMGSFSILIRGTALLQGSESDPIRVTNGYKAFVLMDEEFDATFQAQHTIFINNTGGAIMREWPSELKLPVIEITNCIFQDNEYAVRSYDVEMKDSIITGGRIGGSVHRSELTNVTIENQQEICLFAGSDSEVTNCRINDCGSTGLLIEGVAESVTVSNAYEGISASFDGYAPFAQVTDCTLSEISDVGLKYIEIIKDTIVHNSPTAVGALMTGNTGRISNSILVGNRIGVYTDGIILDDDITAGATIEDSYICGNSQSQFNAVDYAGTSFATRTYFGDAVTAQAEGKLDEIFNALPFMPSAKGTLNYDITDTTVQDMDFAKLQQVDAFTQCGITSGVPPPTTSSTSPPPTASPTGAAATTEEPTTAASPTAAATDEPTTASPTGAAATEEPTTVSPTTAAAEDTEEPTSSPTVEITTVTPPPTQAKKQAPLAAKCGSVATSAGRGGAAGQNKGCTTRGPNNKYPGGRRRKIRGL